MGGTEDVALFSAPGFAASHTPHLAALSGFDNMQDEHFQVPAAATGGLKPAADQLNAAGAAVGGGANRDMSYLGSRSMDSAMAPAAAAVFVITVAVKFTSM